MEPVVVVTLCRQLGCCEACCLRFLGLKSPNVYVDASKYILKYVDNNSTAPKPDVGNRDTKENDRTGDGKDNDWPPAKKQKMNVCVCCLGILQPDTWPPCFEQVKEVLDRKGYECTTFACALSSPLSILIREKAILLRIKQLYPEYDINTLTPLKEAWKWSFGAALGSALALSLGSGADCALLVTLTMDYENDQQEVEVLKSLCPSLFAMRAQQRQRFAALVTRRAAEQALDGVSLEALTALEGWAAVPAVDSGARCASVEAAHAPVYIAGRYVKRSRTLPQTPWLVEGRRVMEGSVQEIIARPIAQLYKLGDGADEAATSRIKFVSAGREDVDVRCLGDGRPFAVEVCDPPRVLTAAELCAACDVINASRRVSVARLQYVTREELGQLKKGEESKAKTYHALCVKLTHHKGLDPVPTRVTAEDIARINAYTNTAEEGVRIKLAQRTPLRVLHRRPLLDRQRNILELSASLVPEHPQLLCIRVVTEAGTYIKEWVHGECGRTTPALGAAFKGTELSCNDWIKRDDTSDDTLAKQVGGAIDDITNIDSSKEANDQTNDAIKVNAIEDLMEEMENKHETIETDMKTTVIQDRIGDTVDNDLNTVISETHKSNDDHRSGDNVEKISGCMGDNTKKAGDCMEEDEMVISVDILALDVVGVHLVWPPPPPPPPPRHS